jgi:hypothetical protein
MAEQQQNGTPRFPEGTIYLLVTFNKKTKQYALVFSEVEDALALHSMSATSLEKLKRDAIAPEAAPQISTVPTFSPGLLNHFNRGKSS